PWAAKAAAIARPTPAPAPVTRMVRPAKASLRKGELANRFIDGSQQVLCARPQTGDCVHLVFDVAKREPGLRIAHAECAAHAVDAERALAGADRKILRGV